jgi:hypothetical protein
VRYRIPGIVAIFGITKTVVRKLGDGLLKIVFLIDTFPETPQLAFPDVVSRAFCHLI